MFRNDIGFRLATGAALLSFALVPAQAREPDPDAPAIGVAVGDLDLGSEKGRIALAYRAGASAAQACDAGERQRGSQFRACVQVAIDMARRTCKSAEATCRITVDRRARPAARARASFGPRNAY